MLPSNYIPSKKDCSQQLRYEFVPAELLERGKKLAETQSKLQQLDNDKKRVVTDFTAKISAVKAEASSLADMVSTGYEVRDIPCTATMDTPTIGKKRITRNDTGEEVSIDPMTPSENSEAADLRSKAEYMLKNPVLELNHSEGEGEDAAGKEKKEDDDKALPGSDEAGEGEDEQTKAPEKPAEAKKTRKGAKPGDNF